MNRLLKCMCEFEKDKVTIDVAIPISRKTLKVKQNIFASKYMLLIIIISLVYDIRFTELP